MKIVLINPSIRKEKFGSAAMLMEPMPCIGLAYIAAVLENDGHTVEVFDNYVLDLNPGSLAGVVAASKPDIVGVSVLTPNVSFALDIAKGIREYLPDVKMIAGNVHPTQFPEEFLGNGIYDAVVRGEGEAAVSELAAAYASGSELSGIRGLSYYDSGRIYHNEKRDIIAELDQLPFPAWHLFPYKKYGLFPFADISKPVLTVLASRGCPFRCKYCSLSYMDRSYRRRSVFSVAEEIEHIIEIFGVKQFAFVDPTFPLEEEYTIELCGELMKRGIHKKAVWISETRVDILNEKLIAAMKDAGCRRIIFGLESGSAVSLETVDKSIDQSRVKDVMRLLKKYKMESIGLFMIGIPGETRESILTTFRYARELDIDFAKFAMTVPFPGSLLYEELKAAGKILTDDWDNYTTFNPEPANVSYVPDGLTASEMIKLQKKGHLDFYLRPKMIFRQLFKIRTLKISMMLKGLVTLFS